MTESDLVRQLRLAATESGARMFRNSVGVLQDIRGQHVRYGLCVGSADLIGWKPYRILSTDVGATVAVFTAIEAKMPGKKPTSEQITFLDAVTKAGGIARLAYCVEDMTQTIEGWRPK